MGLLHEANDRAHTRRDENMRPDSAGSTSGFVDHSLTDPNEPENHRDLNPDCKHAQTCSDPPLA